MEKEYTSAESVSNNLSNIKKYPRVSPAPLPESIIAFTPPSGNPRTLMIWGWLRLARNSPSTTRSVVPTAYLLWFLRMSSLRNLTAYRQVGEASGDLSLGGFRR
eukprot:CCRYP_020319-RC/>CCRYP_020319-RC protein AED:0.47 eAED:1.00 QI:0/0/0/1/0/0/2/0/103